MFFFWLFVNSWGKKVKWNYGLKESHNINDFDTLFIQTGLDEMLKSDDPSDSTKAIFELCLGYFADLHSAPKYPSYYSGLDSNSNSTNISSSILDSYNNILKYTEARSAYYPDGVPGYEEIGNTAYVTFNSFTHGTTDYYSTPATADATETVGLIT